MVRTTSVIVALGLLALASPAAAATDTYKFRDTLQSIEGGVNGNTLAEVSNKDDATIKPGTGSYVDTKIDAYACPNTPTVRGYAFAESSGLRSSNNAPVVATESFTISMIVKFKPLKTGYTRLVDFSNSTLDTGLYVLDRHVNLYASATFAPENFAEDRFSLLTVTRDGATKKIIAYVGTEKAGEFDDVNDFYKTNGNLFFFLDNTTGSAARFESSPGVVSFLRVSDRPVTVDELPALIADACAAAACGNGTKDAEEECDDGNDTNGDGCSSACTIEGDAGSVALPDAGGTPVFTVPDAGGLDLSNDTDDTESCSCKVGPRSASTPAFLAVAFGALVAVARRRRRR